MPRIVPNLWFDNQALEATEFYVSIFPNSRVTTVAHYTEAGPGPVGEVLTVDFELDGQKITGINGGPLFIFSEAVSLLIEAADQDEIDYYWDKLTDGGQESQCGWLKDRFQRIHAVVHPVFHLKTSSSRSLFRKHNTSSMYP